MLNNKDFQEFFKQRMAEIMHKDTLDSYRVRVNNAHTILKELSFVMEGWLAGNVKRFETVELCIEECKSLIEKDDYLDFSCCSKKVFLDSITKYVNDTKNKQGTVLFEESKQILFLVDESLLLNNDKYLEKLLKGIRDFVFTTEEYGENEFRPKLLAFDSVVSSFACELLYLGFSKKYLFNFFNSLKTNSGDLPFESAFEKMIAKFSNLSNKKYTVVIKVSFKRLQNANAASENLDKFVEAIPNDLHDSIGNYKSYVKRSRFIRFYCDDVEALDAFMAAQMAYGHLSEILDYNQDIINDLVLPFYALVFEGRENTPGFWVSQEKFFILDNGGQFLKVGEHVLKEKLQKIRQSSLVENDVKDRIHSALRHLRIGDSQVEMEQRFINYWIALEFLFSSSLSKDSTFARIKQYLVDILSTCYVKRNLLYLAKWMKQEHILENNENIVEKIMDDAVIDSINDVLLKFRIKNMKSHLRKNEDVLKYIGKHKRNLIQHISRIYRLRNELVHEAALKQDIENVTSNLRFYLVFVLNQLVGYFSDIKRHEKPKSMLQFFWEYEKGYKCIADSAISAAMGIKIARSYIL